MSINHPNLQSGLTAEIPYKVFANVAMFWNLVRRNTCVGVHSPNIYLEKEAAAQVSADMVNAIRDFVGFERFTAKSLLKDQVPASEDLHREWQSSLRFFLTVEESNNGVLPVSVGVFNKDPWDGVNVQPIHQSYLKFYMDKGGAVIFSPSQTKVEQPEDFFLPLKVGPYESFIHTSEPVNGQAPSLLPAKDFEEITTKFVDKVFKRLGSEDFKVLKLPKQVESEVDQEAKRLLTDDILSHVTWSGGQAFYGTASISAVLRPMGPSLTSGETTYQLQFCLTARGDFELNTYHTFFCLKTHV